MKIYVIIMIVQEDDLISMEPVGVFSSLKKATKYANQLHDLTIEDEYETDIVYDILEYDLDEKPSLINWLTQQKEKQTAEIEKTVTELMKSGIIDQLIGEDGKFYYTLTDIGKEAAKDKGMLDNLEKFLRNYM